MGRKVHPVGFRLGVNKDWRAKWFAEAVEYSLQRIRSLKEEFLRGV